MKLFKLFFPLVLAFIICSPVKAATGSFTVLAMNYCGWYCGTVGFSKNIPGFGGPSGAIIGGGKFLSDGREVVRVYDWDFGTTNHWLEVAFSGFTADPGSTYLNNLYVTCDDLGYMVQIPASSASYYYYSGYGVASWGVEVPGICMQDFTSPGPPSYGFPFYGVYDFAVD